MALSSKSNTINALGIFGRLESKQEKYFAVLEKRFSKRPVEDDANGIFSHLTLVINKNVSVGEMPKYLDLLRGLTTQLPIIKDDKHLALSFDTSQTQKIRDLASKYFNQGVIETYYTKVVWFVPKENQEEAIKELKKVKELVFYDFILVANRQNDENTIYSSNRFV